MVEVPIDLDEGFLAGILGVGAIPQDVDGHGHGGGAVGIEEGPESRPVFFRAAGNERVLVHACLSLSYYAGVPRIV